MIATEIVSRLARQQVELWTEGDQLRIRAPRGVLTEELRADLALHKADILTLLGERENKERPDQFPQMVPDATNRFEPFALTDIQQAYWVGRSDAFDLGNIACHAYYEVEARHLDLGRFNTALQLLIERHDMLRATVTAGGKQKILETVQPYTIKVMDFRGHDPATAASHLESMRRLMSHQVRPSDEWPLFEVCASRLSDELIRLHLSFDILIVDVWSLQIILREWAKLYNDLEASLVPIDVSFRDYVLAEAELRNSASYLRSQSYWADRLPSLPPPPELPLAVSPASISRPRFVRRSARLKSESWLKLKNQARERGLTPSATLLAAYGEVLAAWSKSRRFTINVTISNRLPLHPQINDIVGDFTTFLPLEVDNSSEASFEARAERIQLQLLDDVEHCQIGGVQILRELARAQANPSVCLPVVFTSLLSNSERGNRTDKSFWMGDVVYGVSQTPQVWLDHQVFEEDGDLIINWDWVEELFPKRMLDDLFEAYCNFLNQLAYSQDRWAETSRHLTPQAHIEERAAINATKAPVSEVLLHSLFSKQADERPNHAAVICGNRSFTYKEIDRLSNQVAHRLRALGARPNSLVGVVMEKGWEQVVAVLAILKSGAAYLPINPETPKERLWYLLEQGEVNLVLTSPRLEQSLEWPDSITRLCLDETPVGNLYDQPLDPVQKPQDLAYVIFTSGSTGKPKGVMINHLGAVGTINDINRRFLIGPGDRVLALSNLSFDLSVYDIFGTLAAGGTIIIPEPPARRDPARWLDLIEQERVTVWNSVPALLEMLVAYMADRRDTLMSRLRLVLLSGDWIPLSLPDNIKALAPSAQVISLGGATEASIWSITYPIDKVDPDWKSIPYGRPMTNQRFHVLNEAMQPVPVWVPGQLYIAGEGLACGYWRDEEKTKASFINHPETGERLYRTGDVGRYLPGGDIEFLGREDYQVKINGYRVELGEIETALLEHPSVRAALVKAVGKLRDSKRLVAYIVAGKDQAPTVEELTRFLKKKLPSYMVPSTLIVLDGLPLTPNGKIDRAGMPNPEEFFSASAPGPNAEATATQQIIAETIGSILGIECVNSQANLLGLGANSIDIVRIANNLEKEFGFRPKLEDFYCMSNVSELAAFIEERAAQKSLDSSAECSQLLLAPDQREAFKNRQPSLRPALVDEPHIDLILTGPTEDLLDKFAERRSHRHFLNSPISLAELSDFLGCLRLLTVDGNPKRLYGSAGGLYPVQVYLQVKPGRVEGMPAGIYYYHPAEHRMVLVSQCADLDRSVHDPFINGPVFDEAAFSVFLIAQLRAIEPLYGDHSLRFATIEAGLISQLLEASAPQNQLGLCQVGILDFERIRHLFGLDEGHVFIHSLLGGRIDANRQVRNLSSNDAFYCAQGEVSTCDEGEL